MKIIIADDEKWVRAAIRSLIPFEKLGMELAGEASNGIEALELCMLYKPDILLTDIMMPGLTGLDLIKELKRCSPDVKIAIISGYSDFGYAKTAMKFGITDYLLKPLEEDELLQVLERFKNEKEKEMKLLKANDYEKEQLRLAAPVLKEAFLNKLVSQNNYSVEKIKTSLMSHEINFKENTFYLAVFSTDSPGSYPAGDNKDYKARILERAMKRYLGAVTFAGKSPGVEFISIINCHNEINRPALDKAFRICSELFYKRLEITMSAGLSESTRQLCMLQLLYTQAVKALDSRFWKGPGKLHIYSPESFDREPDLQLAEEILNKIILNLKLSNLQTALSYVDGIYKELERQCGLNPTYVREYFWQYIQTLISMLNIQLPFIRHETRLTGEQPYERIMRIESIDGLLEYTKELLQRIYDFFHDKHPINSLNMIDNAKKIIEANYSGDINLEQVARHVHLSPAYLSELFKKETGMSFVDYKTIVRIENAKKLLESTSLNIYDISGKVGYTDPKYFSKLFKKITGRTVYEYRKNRRKEGEKNLL